MALYRDILLIDDDPLVLMNYMDVFEDAGFNAVGADSLAQAWREASSRNFDLIVSDHDLGDGNGITMIKRLIAAGKNTPVIYLSAALPSILAEISELPLVRKVLTKPVSPEILLRTVREYLPKIRQENPDIYPQAICPEERDLLLDLFKSNEP